MNQEKKIMKIVVYSISKEEEKNLIIKTIISYLMLDFFFHLNYLSCFFPKY
jgi:hypothetical protein